MRVFIAGPRAIKCLDKNIIMKLKNICQKKYDVLVGDADGIDSSVQKFLKEQNYESVTIYASNGVVRNNCGDWKTKKVIVENSVTGFDFYAQKDMEMAKDSDIGFMIWNGKSKGTFNNIINLLNFEKAVMLYYVVTQQFYHFKNFDDLEKFLSVNIELDSKLKGLLPKKKVDDFVQVSLY